ncbi:PTS sugar transporter subunit IIA [Alkalihalobacillus pseudalcaliphilus]|uniref:PTS sugar transporter subunit IIA n=1 Tax=Alkalihalobacillus pseudalcaliphilus TaxID=79884 RepID=UPI00064E066F|nr:PTS sugar transporter subunit IIA [Alkalihalobacillus pseudalcaliphilus]KMK78043.1 PTS mannitol transporter subunit IIA [Alkalihalobacillus pseudalcaliphilus]
MTKILVKDNIRFSGKATTKEEAIQEVGQILVEKGYVNSNYVEKMLEREEITSTFMGNMLAIPHGTDEGKKEVTASGLAVQIYDQPLDWNGEEVRLVIGIAGVGDEHLEILSQIAIVCSEVENVEKLLQTKSADEVLDMFSEVAE